MGGVLRGSYRGDKPGTSGMKKRNIVLGAAVALVLAGVAAAKWGYWQPEGAVAQAPRATTPRSVPVDVATAT